MATDAPATLTTAFADLRRDAQGYASDAADDAIRRHNESDRHLGRQQRRTMAFGWDSGASGTAITAADTLPRSLLVPCTGELIQWTVIAPYPAPTGDATFSIAYVAPGAAMSTATVISGASVPTLASEAAGMASGAILGVWGTTSLEYRGTIIARLLTAATVEVVEVQLEMRET